MLKDINEDNREHARRLLHCLAVAIRPLRVEELAEILTFDFDDVEGGVPKFHADWRWKDQEEAVLFTCSSLIAVVDHRDSWGDACRVVQFSHFSVKEFLVSDRLASSTPDVSRYHILHGPAHTILAQACLGFLLHLDGPIDWESVSSFPLADYAAEHWVTHAQFEDVASHVEDGMRSLFDPDKRHLVAWLRIRNITLDPKFGPDTANPLYVSAFCGFHDLVEYLVINHPQLVNDIYGDFGSPLLAALSRNHIQIAELLLQHGAKVGARGLGEKTLLHLAITELMRVDGDVSDAVSFLLKHGADANSRADDLSTPLVLHMETDELDFKVVELLLKHGANVNYMAGDCLTPLYMAVREGDFEVVELLLKHGADVNSRDLPLHMAVRRGNFEVVELLLKHGADLHSRDEKGKTPMHLASDNVIAGSSDVAQLLLERGADVNSQDNDYATPLLIAVHHPDNPTGSFLLDHGADPNVKNDDGDSLMHLLFSCNWMSNSESDVLSLTRSLLEHGAEPNVANKDGKTPLHLVLEAIIPYYREHNAEMIFSRFALLLLHHGADVNAQDKGHRTPLFLAIQQKMHDLSRALVTHGAEPNLKDDNGKTPLHVLLENNSSLDFCCDDIEDDILDLTRLLLRPDRGADVNALDKHHATPLLLAAERYMDNITRLLLERGADPNVKNSKGKTTLHILLERKFYDDIDVLVILRLLLECGADVNVQDDDNTTPLHLASNHRRREVAQIIFASANWQKDRHPAQLHVTLGGVYNPTEEQSHFSQF